MQIAGYEFRPVLTPTLSSAPGIYLYIHQASGKCFVRAMRNARMQKSKNNYPNQLKELLKTNSSTVLIYLADLEKDTKEACFLASRAVASLLAERGSLFKKPKNCKGGIYRTLPGEEEALFTIWVMTHKATGAVYYFEERKGLNVAAKVSQRMLTYNNYVIKDLTHINRVMSNFAKKFFPMDISQWMVRDLDASYMTELEAQKHITKLCKNHLEANEVVLNRVSNLDAIYYRNSLLKLPHKSMEEYLKFV